MGELATAISGQKAVAALGAVVGPQLLGFLPVKIQSPGIAIAVGVGVAWAGAALTDGYFESFLIGVGVGMAARGALGMIFKVQPTM